MGFKETKKLKLLAGETSLQIKNKDEAEAGCDLTAWN
jgi:hypothetical protein